jgi:hypothetical protein
MRCHIFGIFKPQKDFRINTVVENGIGAPKAK